MLAAFVAAVGLGVVWQVVRSRGGPESPPPAPPAAARPTGPAAPVGSAPPWTRPSYGPRKATTVLLPAASAAEAETACGRFCATTCGVTCTRHEGEPPAGTAGFRMAAPTGPREAFPGRLPCHVTCE